MTDQEVQLFLADLAIIILLAQLLGRVARRLGQPPVIGEIIAGILLGPTLFHGRITAALFPATLRPPLTALANLGVVMFMFAVGYLLDLRLIRGHERAAASVSVSSIILPLSLGIGLGTWLASRHHVHQVLPFALFVGTAMSVTAFPVLARILTDRGMHLTRIGSIALASAAIDDVLAWVLLCAVAAIADAGSQPLRLLLAPVYVGVMFFAVRPLVHKLAAVDTDRGRPRPSVIAIVLAGLLLSSYATDWMGVKYIFGAFLFGVIMPRAEQEQTEEKKQAAAALRQEIHNGLEQVSVLVLLPVFFVVSGLSVNLSSVSASGLVELGLILLVAVVGKFAGAFAGARFAGVPARDARVLATLMNTRGLTGIVILSVGLQLHILDQSLYSLMIVMAIVTTVMAGPLLRLFYPARFLERDISEADWAVLGAAAGPRILVLIEAQQDAASLVEAGAALAASQKHSQLVLCDLAAQESDLQALADLASSRGARVAGKFRFTLDVATRLPGYVAAGQPDTVVLGPDGPSHETLAADGANQLVTVLRSLPDALAVAVLWTPGEDGAAAVRVARHLADARGLNLVISPAGGPSAEVAAGLAGDGVAAMAGPPPAGAIIVAAATDTSGDAHLTVLAGTRETAAARPSAVRALDGVGS
jgi:Kef-type K+ transport system membrane component KefB